MVCFSQNQDLLTAPKVRHNWPTFFEKKTMFFEKSRNVFSWEGIPRKCFFFVCDGIPRKYFFFVGGPKKMFFPCGGIPRKHVFFLGQVFREILTYIKKQYVHSVLNFRDPCIFVFFSFFGIPILQKCCCSCLQYYLCCRLQFHWPIFC